MAKTNSNPEVRFAGFSEDWKVEKLLYLADFSKGNGYSKKDLTEKGNPILLYGRLYTNYQTVIKSVETFVNAKSVNVLSKGGEVVIPASGETQEDIIRASVVEQKNIILGGDLNIVVPKGELNSVFLALSISNGRVYKDLVKKTQGKSVVHIRNNDLSDTFIPYPEKNEQKLIGIFFENIDKLIAEHQQKHAKLKSLKQAMLDKMFPKQGQLVPEIRFKGFDKNWEKSKLGDEVDFFTGLTYSPFDVVKSNGTFVIRSSNIKNGKLVDADNVYVNSNKVNCVFVKKHDIAVVVRNGSRDLIGKHAQIKTTIDNAVIGAFMTGLRSELPNFINALLDSKQFKNEINKNLGATINQITTGNFKEMRFLFPKNEEQKMIGDYFENIDNLIRNHEKQITKLQNIKKAFLTIMFI